MGKRKVPSSTRPLPYTTCLGAATKSWRRFVEERGSGFRAPAQKWKKGTSGKQNKSLDPADGFSKKTVSRVTHLFFLLLFELVLGVMGLEGWILVIR